MQQQPPVVAQSALVCASVVLLACSGGSLTSVNAKRDGGAAARSGKQTDGGSTSGKPSTSTGSGGQASDSGSGPAAGDAGDSGSGPAKGDAGHSMPGLPHVRGTPDTSVKTALPALPALTNVTANAIGDNVSLQFDPIDGALDYRVYELPADSDVSHDSDGHVTVKNATYRCAGNRQAPAPTLDNADWAPGGGIKTQVDNVDVGGFKRQLADATLGYVYATAGTGRVPVYALGDGSKDGDNSCYFQRWATSRVKKYTASESERADLLAQGWRDDGIAFYVPDAKSGGTRTVYTSGDDSNVYYFADGPEADARSGKQEAFPILSAEGDADTKPLMRVFYMNRCGKSHDELAAGQARFERARRQGDLAPLFELHYSGITGPTTLVVEALADLCPYQGFWAPKSDPAYTADNGTKMEAWMTLEDLRAASSTGEVYINGQDDSNTTPRPIARSFVKISPGPKPDLDWFVGFDSKDPLGNMATTKCGALDGNCWQQFRQTSSIADATFYFVESNRWAMAPVLGELLVTYSDVGADVNGKFRITAGSKAQMNADGFLHVTMTVDSVSTARRYPQIMISDRDAPVQDNMSMGSTLVIETFMDWPNTYQLEVCDHRPWDVNNQCPSYDTYNIADPKDSSKMIGLAPSAEVGEHAGPDRDTVFDVYTSTKRAYLFLDGEPYGCADLPASGVPSGDVTVTFGDVLYHSGVDHLFTFYSKHLHFQTHRHFDNLGFKSGVAAPVWDEKRFPCATTLK